LLVPRTVVCCRGEGVGVRKGVEVDLSASGALVESVGVSGSVSWMS
jgi:hypothetical protein